MTLTRLITPIATLGVLLGSLASTPAALAAAGPTSNQPINVSANALSVSDRAGTATYTGNVHVVQGDMTLDAPRLDLYRNNQTHQASRAKATGNGSTRAYMDQKATQTDPEMKAWGDTITYYIPQHKIVVEGHAELHRGSDVFHGPYVEYFIDSRQVNAHGGNSSSGSSSTTDQQNGNNGSGRVNMTITPQQQNQ